MANIFEWQLELQLVENIMRKHYICLVHVMLKGI